MTKTRKEINDKYKWDIESMYDNLDTWEEDLSKAKEMSDEFMKYQGHLGDGSDVLLESLESDVELSIVLERVYIFARMKRDEDNSNETFQGLCDRAMSLAAEISAKQAFYVPELIGLGEDVIKKYLEEEPKLEMYTFMLNNILRRKAHILSMEEEGILAQMSEVTGATQDIFTMLNNADLTFGEITDEDGNTVPLTHGNYIKCMQSHDRNIREQAFHQMYESYKSLINTIGSAYNYNTKTDVVGARIRKYSSSRAAALYSDNVDEEVYDNLIKVVNEHLPAMHKYIDIRKRALGVDEIKMWDMYVPLVQIPKRDIPYEEAQEIILEALKPMGQQYIDDITFAFNDRWADVYETPGKTSGAYSFGSYDSKPFVLLNYTNTLQDVFTVIHEFGHSMHSFYTRKEQPFIYGSHSIFTAEVASTVNENLLMKHLIATEEDPEMIKYLINLHLEEFRTTLFRQTMFAEFEHLTHKQVEEGGSLTPKWLCETYDELNNKYFGPSLSHDDFIQYEWARIPHFYNAFYVYKYATGYSAASALSDIILKDGPDNYLKFLTTGDSDFPIELLKIAGVDMASPEPIEAAMKVFEALVDKLDKLI